MKVDIQRNWRIKPRIVIHAHDTWSMDTTLAQIIFPMLKRLKDAKIGTPGVMFPDNHHQLESEERERVYEEARAKWEGILDKMIWSMERIAFSKDGPALPIPTAQKGMTRSQRYKRWSQTVPSEDFPGCTTNKWKDEIDPVEKAKWLSELKEHNRRLQEGCELFGKYFQNLWC